MIENIKKVEFLKKYLGARFTLTNGMKPHLMNFWKKKIFFQIIN